MDKNRLLEFLNKYEANTCSDSELAELEQWYASINTGNQPIDTADDFADDMLRQFRTKVSSLTPVVPFYRKKIFRVAAAAIILVAVSIFYFQKSNDEVIHSTVFNKSADETNSSSLIEQINNSDSIQFLTLTDASTVQLFPKSKLSFTQSSFSNKREVFLTGEAFFEVQKNPSVPFFVYTKDLVTKVLGTSFKVKAYEKDKNSSVLVVTGKVSVYKRENFSASNAEGKKLDGLIVTDNQQVIYDFSSNQLNKTIVDMPALLEKRKGQNAFVFNSTPLRQVFAVLQDAYGITIMYDESAIDSCSLSASLGNESYFEKLNLICKAIDASYEIMDGTVFINSHGCK